MRGLVHTVAAKALHARDHVVLGLWEGVAVAQTLVDTGGERDGQILDGQNRNRVVEDGGWAGIVDGRHGAQDFGDDAFDHVDGAGDHTLGAGHGGGEERDGRWHGHWLVQLTHAPVFDELLHEQGQFHFDCEQASTLGVVQAAVAEEGSEEELIASEPLFSFVDALDLGLEAALVL